jgi:hypothetical protein
VRIPLFKPWRAFSQLDSFSDEECEKFVGDAWANCRPVESAMPIIVGPIMFLVWPGLVLLGLRFPAIARWIFVPQSSEAAIVLLVVTSVFVGCTGALIARDVVLYLLLRRELGRADCPKCGQSLRGLPVQSVGEIPDPAKNFVRCAECGRVHHLLDLGLAPRDLVPLERRRVPPDFASKRGR